MQTADVAKKMVTAGLGMTVSFAAAIGAGTTEANALRAVPIEGLYLNRYVAKWAGRPVSRGTEALEEILYEVARRLVRERAGRMRN